MKIVFFPSSMLPFHGKTLEERAIGGMETAVIRLADALAVLGHEVIVFAEFDNPPLTKALFLPLKTFPQIGPIDVFVAVREWGPVFAPKECKKFFFWTGDSYDLPQNAGIGDKRVTDKLDGLLCVSDWHADMLCRESGFPREKAFNIRNGVHLPLFEGKEDRRRKRLIYSSTPYRGLKYLPQVFKTLKEKHPELELHIFSDYKVYSKTDKTEFYEPAMKELAELRTVFSQIPGCFMHGNVTQAQLAREMMKSSILAYPNTFEETSCITAIEAQAAGCAIVTSSLGALPETVGEAGIIIKETPGSDSYIKEFTEAVDRVLSDDSLFSSLSAAGRRQAEDYDWAVIARRFIDLLM